MAVRAIIVSIVGFSLLSCSAAGQPGGGGHDRRLHDIVMKSGVMEADFQDGVMDAARAVGQGAVAAAAASALTAVLDQAGEAGREETGREQDAEAEQARAQRLASESSADRKRQMEAVKQARTRTTTRRLPRSPLPLSLSHSRAASMACVFTAGIGGRRPEILFLCGDRDVKTRPLGAELVPEKDLQDRRSPRHCDIWVDGRRAYSLSVHAERVLESSVCIRECHAGGQVGAAGCG